MQYNFSELNDVFVSYFVNCYQPELCSVIDLVLMSSSYTTVLTSPASNLESVSFAISVSFSRRGQPSYLPTRPVHDSRSQIILAHNALLPHIIFLLARRIQDEEHRVSEPMFPLIERLGRDVQGNHFRGRREYLQTYPRKKVRFHNLCGVYCSGLPCECFKYQSQRILAQDCSVCISYYIYGHEWASEDAQYKKSMA